MIALGTPAKLPQQVLLYWLTQLAISALILGGIAWTVITWMIAPGSTIIVNGVPSVVSEESANMIRTVSLTVILFGTLVSVVYRIFYWKMFSYTVHEDRMSVVSGIIFIEDKAVQYHDAQSSSVNRGPLQRLFGLASLKIFTSSPQQLEIVSSNNGGSRTIHRPDVDVILPITDAEFVSSKVSTSIPTVRAVTA